MQAICKDYTREFEKTFILGVNGDLVLPDENSEGIANFVKKYIILIRSITDATLPTLVFAKDSNGYVTRTRDNNIRLLYYYSHCFVTYTACCKSIGVIPNEKYFPEHKLLSF